jgi:hypothetical protein
LLYETTAPRELRLNRYAPFTNLAWSPSFRSSFVSTIFGTDLPQGSAGPANTRSIFSLGARSREFRRLSLAGVFERANPVVQPLPIVAQRGSSRGIGGTQGRDAFRFSFGSRALTVTSPGSSLADHLGEGRTVIRGGYAIAYDRGFNVVLRSLGGNDTVTLTGTVPTNVRGKLTVTLDCGPGADSVVGWSRLEKLFRKGITKGCETRR